MSDYLFESDFETQINGVIAGQYDLQSAMRVRPDTPKLLQKIGLDNLPILYSTRHMLQGLGLAGTHEFHSIDKRTAASVPESLEHPLFIAEEKNRIGTLDFGLSLSDPEVDGSETLWKPVFLSMQVSGNGIYNKKHIPCNFIKTFFGIAAKEQWANRLVNAATEGRLLYVDKEGLSEFTKNWDSHTKEKLALALKDFSSCEVLQESRSVKYIHNDSYRQYVSIRYGNNEQWLSAQPLNVPGFTDGMNEEEQQRVLQTMMRDRQNAMRGAYLNHERLSYDSEGPVWKNGDAVRVMDPQLTSLIRKIEQTPCEYNSNGRALFWGVRIDQAPGSTETSFTISTSSMARIGVIITGKCNRSCPDKGLAIQMGKAMEFKNKQLMNLPEKEDRNDALLGMKVAMQRLICSIQPMLIRLEHNSVEPSSAIVRMHQERGARNDKSR